MKILLLTHLFPDVSRPGFGTFNLSRMKALERAGHEVLVVCPLGITPPEKDLFPIPQINKLFKLVTGRRTVPKRAKVEGIEVYYPRWFWLPKRWFWQYEARLLDICAGQIIRSAIDNYKPDLVLSSWMHPFGTYMYWIKKYYRGSMLSIAEGGDLLQMPGRYRGWPVIEKKINAANQTLLFVSGAMQREAEIKLHLRKGYILNNGYDEQSFYFTEKWGDGGLQEHATGDRTLKRDKIVPLQAGGVETEKVVANSAASENPLPSSGGQWEGSDGEPGSKSQGIAAVQFHQPVAQHATVKSQPAQNETASSQPAQHTTASGQRSWPVSFTGIRLISVGNLVKIKGHDILLLAMTLLDKSFYLTIIGEGEERPNYEKFIRDKGLEDRVCLRGRIANNELRPLLAEADYFCMPSRSESFGIAAVEAMACGLPVIASDTGGLSDLVQKGFNGALFCAGDAASLAEKLNYCQTINWNRSAIADWTKENYALSKWVERLMQLRNIAGQPHADTSYSIPIPS